MNSWRLILRSLVFHRRINLAVALGVMAGTAVLVGALVVGDSVRASLRRLTVERLGNVAEVLVAPRFFRPELAQEVAGNAQVRKHFSHVEPAVFMQGALREPEQSRQASHVSVYAFSPALWQIAGPAATLPGDDEIVLNAPLAESLSANVGGELLLRLPTPSDIPPDSPLGKKTDAIRTRRLTVTAIVPAEGPGRFGLRPNQRLPLNAWVAPSTLQTALEQDGLVNALVATTSGPPSEVPPPAAHEALEQALHPTLADLGLHLDKIEGPAGDYYNLTADTMILPDVVVKQALTAFPAGAQPVMTYLANTLAHGTEEIPYSTITGVDSIPELGPLLDDGQPIKLADDEIVLIDWAAERLDAKPGDEIRFTYFLPEATHGVVAEQTVSLKLRQVVPLAPPDEPKLPTNDPHLTPEMKGITDQLTLGDWDPPFPYDSSRIGGDDEQYWTDHRTTPKAYVSLATARRLFGSRFGGTTSIRLPVAKVGADRAAIVNKLNIDPARLNFEFMPVRAQGLAAASGTTSFSGLFLGFSFFIIASAVMLVALLFRLGVEQRAEEIGILKATGISPARVSGMLAGEALLVAAVGGLLGVAAGVGYAWLMIVGLTTWWLDAITTPFLDLAIDPLTLAVGYPLGVGVSLAAILWSLWRMRKISVRRLLAGQATEASEAMRGRGRVSLWISLGSLVLAVTLAIIAWFNEGMTQVGMFFGSGALMLIAGIAAVWHRLRYGRPHAVAWTAAGALARLASRNGQRNPSRSTLTIGLVASASFLIVALSAFQLDPAQAGPKFDSGNGGFTLIAESDLPLFYDPNTSAGLQELGVSDDESQALAPADVASFRVKPGDDASCLNLYQTQQPRVLGAPKSFLERGGFSWMGAAANTAEEKTNPWLLLERTEGPVPVVLDMNTATYSLHLSGVGARYTIQDGRGQDVELVVVGLLMNSIFQGDIVMSEANFQRLYPEVSGYRYFLIRGGDQPTWEQALGEFGFDAVSTVERLREFLAVQNTYISTFQSLGGLGLLLGTLGLAVVQLRNVLERRGELALMRATGFPRSRLAWLVMIENALLLVGGLATGVIAAAVAIAPHLLAGGAAVPLVSLALTLLLVLFVGLLAGLFAVSATLRAPLLPALRGE